MTETRTTIRISGPSEDINPYLDYSISNGQQSVTVSGAFLLAFSYQSQHGLSLSKPAIRARMKKMQRQREEDSYEVQL
jgi:hypothetical protein